MNPLAEQTNSLPPGSYSTPTSPSPAAYSVPTSPATGPYVATGSPPPAVYSVPYSPDTQYATLGPMPLQPKQNVVSAQHTFIPAHPAPAPQYTSAAHQAETQGVMVAAPAQNAQVMPQDGHGSGLSPWLSPIFDCFNPAEQCFMACFCPCVVFGKSRARLRDPTLGTYDTVNSDCALWSVLGLCGLSCIYQWMSRKEIRARYALKGDGAEDAVWTICCPVCALVQEEKEIIFRTTGQRPPVKVDPGYQPQQGMEMRNQ